MNNLNMNKVMMGQVPATGVVEMMIPANIIQTRELLYRLIISQLFYDGYQQVAVTLSNMGNIFIFIYLNIYKRNFRQKSSSECFHYSLNF